MGKLRVGIVGYGQIGPVHLRSYSQIPDKAEVVAVVDLLEDRREQARVDYGVERLISDYHELLAMTDIDIVSVCLPTHLHHDLVIKAAAAGKHVFCEKPMAMDLADAYAMEQRCRSAGVKLQLGFVRRFDNEWMKFGELVRSKSLGERVVWRSVAASHGAPTPWFFQKRLGGGPFMDGAVHNYDFGHFLFGKVKTVRAQGTILQPNRTVMDTGTAIVEYESGDILQMMWSWGLPLGCAGGSAHDVLGTTGALLFSGATRDVDADPAYGHLTIRRANGASEEHAYRKNDMFRDEMESFVDAVLEDREPMVTAAHGQEALRVALAVLEAAETGDPVCL